MKLRIRQTRYDNWYGYRGTRLVIQFTETTEETQEQQAKRWLEENGPENFERMLSKKITQSGK